MSFRITNSSVSSQRLHQIPVSATTQNYLYHDVGLPTGLTNPPTTYAAWYYCEHTNETHVSFGTRYTIWDTNSGGPTGYGFNLSLVQFTVTSGMTQSIGYLTTADVGRTGYGYAWHHGGSQVVSTENYVFDTSRIMIPPTNPLNRWHFISCTIEPNAAASYDFNRLIIYDPIAATSVIGSGLFNPSGLTSLPKPTQISIGNGIRVSSIDSNTFNAKGVCIPAILRGTSFWNGTSSTVDVRTTIAATSQGLIGHISYGNFGATNSDIGHSGCVFSANYAAVAHSNSLLDSRAGRTANGSNMVVYDVSAAGFTSYHDYPRGASAIGNIISVDPYTLTSSIPYPLPTDLSINSEFSILWNSNGLGLPTGYIFSYGATGASSGYYLQNFAKYITNPSGATGQIRIGVYANSRATFNGQVELRLSDGTYTGRKMFANFNDMGIIGQANLWNGGYIVGGLVPIPTCSWSTAGGDSTFEGNYGPDCSTELLRTVSSSGTVTGPSNVLTSLLNTTLGSRFGYVSKLASTVPSDGASLNNYRGNGCAIRLSPGCKYRVMVRPENGLTTGNPLELELHLINHPSSSRIVSANYVFANSQGSTANSVVSITSIPGMGASSAFSPPALKTITSITNPVLTDQVTHTTYGSVRVDDIDNGFQNLNPGDMVQLYTSGATSNTYNEAWIARTVSGKGTTSCNITYEWMPRQYPVTGDRISFIKSNEILKTVSHSGLTANPNIWRGIEIEAATSGDGLLLWGFEYRNTARNGIIVIPSGRNGCGIRLWDNRISRIDDSTNTSLADRLYGIANFNALVLSTADQGNFNATAVNSYRDAILNLKTDSPSTELMLYSSGPEYNSANENINKQDVGDKYDYTAVMQYAGITTGIPHAAFLYSRNISSFGRLQTGDDASSYEYSSVTHPTTLADISFLATQISSLPPGPTAPPNTNIAPTARLSYSPSTIYADQFGTYANNIVVSGLSSTDDGSISSYVFNWTSLSGATSTTVAGGTASISLPTGLTNNVTLIVFDNAGATGATSINIPVLANRAPTASFNANPGFSTFVGLGITFTSASTDPGAGGISGHSWSVTPGSQTGSGSIAGFTFGATGTYTVLLTVTDNLGATGTTTGSVTVSSGASGSSIPTARILVSPASPLYDHDGNSSEVFVLSATASTVVGANIQNYLWSNGSTGTTTSITVPIGITYPSLLITDTFGATSATSTALTVFQNPAPTAIITVTPNATVTDTDGDGMETLLVSGLNSFDEGTGTIATYQWNTGSTGATFSQAFSVTGSPHTVWLIVGDNVGATTYISQQIIVRAKTRGAGSVGAGSTVWFAGKLYTQEQYTQILQAFYPNLIR